MKCGGLGECSQVGDEGHAGAVGPGRPVPKVGPEPNEDSGTEGNLSWSQYVVAARRHVLRVGRGRAGRSGGEFELLVKRGGVELEQGARDWSHLCRWVAELVCVPGECSKHFPDQCVGRREKDTLYVIGMVRRTRPRGLRE